MKHRKMKFTYRGSDLQSLNLATWIDYAAYIKINGWCEARWEYSISIDDIYSMCDEA